jgi:hypothetical protein
MTKEEDKEFEEASKNMKTLGLKKALREQGINTKKLPMYKIDEIRMSLDKSQNVQNKYQPKFKELQDKYQESMNQLNTEMQAEATEARAEVDKLILQVKTDQGAGITMQAVPEPKHDQPEQKQESEKEIVA